MRPLLDRQFDPSRPLQTKEGARAALRCGRNKVNELAREGKLKVVYLGRSARITTDSILEYARHGDRP